jgi:SAM-dependent methyltransferase
MQSFISRLKTSFERRSTRVTWDGLYATGECRRYDGLEQFSRYAIIEGYCKWLGDANIILEIGCGAGTLIGRLDKNFVRSYLGVDISPAAIEMAREVFPGGNFIVGSGEAADFSDQRFSLIIFNESLYCLNPMESHFRRYLSYLFPGGHAIVSITDLRTDAQQAFEKAFGDHITSRTRASDHASGKSWELYLLTKEPSRSADGGVRS